MIHIRNYQNVDYPEVEALYHAPNSFGGQFDSARDSYEQLAKLIEIKPNAILVAEDEGKIVGTVTIFEDGRSAWLYRFAIQQDNHDEVAQAIWNEANDILKQMGHTQVLVYAPVNEVSFEERYTKLGFEKGADYTAFWQDLK